MERIASELVEHGFALDDHFFDQQQIINLEADLFNLGAFDYTNNTVSSASLLSSCVTVYNLANGPEIRQLLQKLGRGEMFPVKAFILDKTQTNNWAIPWHQDLKIAVSHQLDLRGYCNWSFEAGILHVQPPAEVMSRLITVRIHLDDCGKDNGAINVIPGSHAHGSLSKIEIQSILETTSKVLCCVKRHGAMFMNPLILHDSPPSVSSSPRRILQIEYGYDLGNGLKWH